MTPEGARKLLGGYATGTLTDEERKTLLEAAMHDQELFDALANEEFLRQALSDEPYRRELAVMLTPERRFILQRFATWWRRPARLAWAGSLAALAIVAVVVYDAYPPPAVREVDPTLLMIGPDTETLAQAPAAVSGSKPEARKQSRQPAHERVLADRADAVTPAPTRQETTRAFRAPAPDPHQRARLIIEEPPAVAAPDLRIKEEDLPAVAPVPPPPAKEAQTSTTGPNVVAVQKEQKLRKTSAATEAGSVFDSAEQKKKLRVPLRRTAPVVGQSSTIMMARPGMAGYLAQPAGPLVLRIERRTPEGAFVEVSPTAPMAINDEIRLVVKVAGTGHLYLIDKGSADTPHLLASLAVQPDVIFLVPAQGTLPPPENTGVRTLVLLFSEKPLSLDVLGVGGKLDAKAATSSQVIILNYR